MTPFLTTSQLIRGRVRDVFLPKHSSILAWTRYLGDEVRRVVRSCPDLDYANDAVTFAETTIFLRQSRLNSDCPIGIPIKRKVEAFGFILDAIIESIPVSVENVEVTQKLTYLGRVIHSSTNCKYIDGWDEPGARWICWTNTCGKGRSCELFSR